MNKLKELFEMKDPVIELEAKIIEMEARLMTYETALKNIADSETFECAKRSARIALG